MKKYYITSLILTFLLCFFADCQTGFTPKKVHTIRKPATEYEVPTITDKEKFLNDLMLSPYWKVEQEKNETYRARARSLSEDMGSTHFGYKSTDSLSAMLLFLCKNKGVSRIPEGYIYQTDI